MGKSKNNETQQIVPVGLGFFWLYRLQKCFMRVRVNRTAGGGPLVEVWLNFF